MVKRISFFLFVLSFAVVLMAGDLGSEIEKNLAKIPYSSKKELIKANNSLKNLYIKAIIEEDNDLQKKALIGIIKSSKILGFPYERYQRAYEKLTGRVYKESLKDKFVSKKKTDYKISKIRNISFDKNSITIRFDRPIRESDIKIYDLNRNRKFIKVIDIKTNLFFIPPKISIPSLKRVKIAQNRKDLVRVVLESKKRIKLNYSFKDDKIILNFSNSKTPLSNKKAKSNTKINTSAFSSFSKFYSTKIVVIDPGHGGKDSGAIGYQGKEEKRAVLSIAKKVAKELKRRGFKVYLTRDRDIFINLRERTKIANRKMADIFVSIHANAAPNKKSYLSMKGIETYFLSPARSERAKNAAALENKSDMAAMDYFSKEIFLNFYNRERIIASNKLAIDVQAGILKNLRKKYRGVVDGGVREGPFWVLVGAQMPSILIEVGYITNPTDAKRLFNPFFQKILAKGIADGIESYFLKNR